MPFKSEKQRKYLFANNPDVAKKFIDDENNSFKTSSRKRSNYLSNLRKKDKKDVIPDDINKKYKVA